MTERDKVLTAFLNYAGAEGRGYSETDVARKLGIDTRRLSRWRNRERLDSTELFELLSKWHETEPPVHLMLHETGFRVEPCPHLSGVNTLRIARPFLQAGDAHRVGQGLEIARAIERELLSIIRRSDDIIRAVVLRAHLVGALTDAWQSSVAFEVVRPPTQLAARSWIARDLEPSYIKMLRSLGNTRSHRLVTVDLPVGDLRAVYERDGIAISEVRLLADASRGIWYLSLGSGSRSPDPTADSVASLGRLCASLESLAY